MNPDEAVQTISVPADVSTNDFELQVVKDLRVRNEDGANEIMLAVETLARRALDPETVISDNTIATVQGIIAAIDRKLSEQMNVVIHHPDYRKLESAWRGLQHLVKNTETDEMLKIKVMNITKDELHATLMKFAGAAWDQSPLFKKLYEAEYGTLGGEPFGCLVGD